MTSRIPGAVFWPVRSVGNETGNFIGYSTANLGMMRALARLVPVVGDPEKADGVSCSLCHPLAFRPQAGLRNFLFTMFEAPEIPDEFFSTFARADGIIVPAEYSRRIFRAALAELARETGVADVARIPIHLVPLGIEAELFTYKRRRPRPGRPFRWLAVCAPNPRKWSILEQAFGVLRNYYGAEVELYVKTTAADLGRGLAELARAGAGANVEKTPEGDIVRGAGANAGWTIDSRRLPRERLPELYHQADGFVALHMGEGFGLTPLEAMATGLPCVVTDATGTQDFCKPDCSYPVAVDEGLIPVETRDGRRLTVEGFAPRLDAAIDQMVAVMEDPHRAAVVGRRASEVASRYSWRAAAEKLRAVLRS